MTPLSSVLPAPYRDAFAPPHAGSVETSRPEVAAPRSKPDDEAPAAMTGAGEVASAGHPILRGIEVYYANRSAAAEQASDAVAKAAPARSDGATPVMTADQRRLIQSIASRYEGRVNLAAMVGELWANGVHPGQIASGAQLWSYPDGRIISTEGREVAPPKRGILA
ncbi:MAG TPA: hypothetical protein VEB64_04515 [Azospirillaceae bacterium]|nr:hypothetical protein [Azospirillaceae bacterium]